MKRGKEEENGKGEGEIVSVSVMLMMPDTTVPLGISRKHAVSILAYLHPVYWLPHPILRVCVCVRVYIFASGTTDLPFT